jgi:hypothetical protein
VDEIKKLAHCKYFLQLDGANAYWSIPVCEESMRLCQGKKKRHFKVHISTRRKNVPECNVKMLL